MSTSTWTGGIVGEWDDPGNWSPAGVPDASSDVTIATGDAVASASIGTVNSITNSSDLDFESAGTNTVTTFLDNTGSLNVDDSAGEGGTILNIGGTLTNSHHLAIGNATLAAQAQFGGINRISPARSLARSTATAGRSRSRARESSPAARTASTPSPSRSRS